MYSLMPSTGRADNFTWTGDVDDLWNGHPGNWSPLGIPASGDFALFEGASANTTIRINGEDPDGHRSIAAVFFSGDTDYTLFGNAIIENLHLLSGGITADGTATHTVDAEVVLGSNASWFIGNPEFRVMKAISGPFDLRKFGPGLLNLTGTNTYTGVTEISEGTLKVGTSGNAIPNKSVVFMDPSDTLQIDGVTERINGLENFGTVSLTNGATLELQPSLSQSFLGLITGDASTSLVKRGNATQRLVGNLTSSFSGETTIDGGTI